MQEERTTDQPESACSGRPTVPAELLFARWPCGMLYSPYVGVLGMKPQVGKESMPKPATHTLIWSARSKTYALVTPDHPPQEMVPGNEEAWIAWLTTHSSFSFHGQSGFLSVLKESRKRGAGYWYAYHTKESHTRKRYLGPIQTLTLLPNCPKAYTSK